MANLQFRRALLPNAKHEEGEPVEVGQTVYSATSQPTVTSNPNHNFRRTDLWQQLLTQLKDVPYPALEDEGKVLVLRLSKPKAEGKEATEVHYRLAWEYRAEEYNSNASTYREGQNIEDLAVNGTILADGTMPRSAIQELIENFSGENPDKLLIRQAPVELAQGRFVPRSEMSSNFVHSNYPWMNLYGTPKRIMPVSISTNLINTPVGIPLFQPTRANDSGILTFRYIGKEPIHTSIEGSLSFLLRSARIDEDAYARVILRLESNGHPELEQGQNNGYRALGTTIGGFANPFHIENYTEYNDLCLPIGQVAIDNSKSWPDLYVGYDHGFFASNYAPDTEELATEDDLGPVGPEVRTTKWMDVGQYVDNRQRFIMTFEGKSTRTRVQTKDADGNIRIYTQFNRDGLSSERIYRFPRDAKYARIYFSGRGDTVDADSIQFRPLGPETSAEYDPLGGLWTERTIHVQRDITFWPGAEYWFNLFTQVYEGASARSWGFRMQSGGLSFLFDAGSLRKQLATAFFKE